MRFEAPSVAAALLTCSLGLAGTQVRGPLLTFDLDASTGLLRPVWGAPGAAWAGAPLDIGAPLARVAASPLREYLIATLRDEPRTVLIDFSSESPVMRDLPGVRPGEVAISPGGAFAAVHAGGRVQLLTGLPDAPSIEFDIEVPQPLTALAASDNGAVLVGSPGGVFAAGRTSVRLVMPARQPSAIAFLHQRDEALAADREEGTVYRLRGSYFEPAVAEAGGFAAPVAVGVSADNQRAFAVNGSGTIWVIALDTRTATTLTAPAPVRSLDALAGESVFRLTTANQFPMWVLDGGRAEPVVRFVPGPSGAAGRSSGDSKVAREPVGSAR